MTDRVLRGQPLIEIDGRLKYLHGANYAWRNYGEFGTATWANKKRGDIERVSLHQPKIDADFEAMAKQGVTVVRWFLFTDGRNGIEFNGKNIAGLANGVEDDIDAAIAIAEKHNIRLVFSLLDHHVQEDGAHPEIVGTAAGRKDFVEKIVRPLLNRYGGTDTIFAWEVMSEPDFIVAGMQPNANVSRPLSGKEFAEFTRAVADEVHNKSAALVTLGGGRAKFIDRWDDPTLGLDFLQVHFYYDPQHPDWEDDIFGKPASALGRSLPIVIGEVPGINDLHNPPVTNTRFLEWGRQGGFAGLWMWAFTPEDPQPPQLPKAPYDYGEMRDFARMHPEFSNPAALDFQPSWRMRLKSLFDKKEPVLPIPTRTPPFGSPRSQNPFDTPAARALKLMEDARQRERQRQMLDDQLKNIARQNALVQKQTQDALARLRAQSSGGSRFGSPSPSPPSSHGPGFAGSPVHRPFDPRIVGPRGGTHAPWHSGGGIGSIRPHFTTVDLDRLMGFLPGNAFRGTIIQDNWHHRR